MTQEPAPGHELGHILVVDDDEDMGALVCQVAEDVGFTAHWFADHSGFLKAAETSTPVAMFVDLHLPEVDGVEILKLLDTAGSRAAIFIMSGFDSRVLKTATEFAVSKGLRIVGSFTKPIDVAELEESLRSVIPTASSITPQRISQGLRDQEFFVRYQPKLALSPTGADTVDAAEALVRWQHPKLGELSPGSFIPLAEQEGLIGNLTDRVIELASQQIRRWADDGLNINVAINLSPFMLDKVNLPDRYAGILRDAGVEPSQITIEITESGVMKDVADTAEILMRFRLKGFGLSIDDFGTGFSSLVELYRMPFNELKIDRAFVEPAPNEKEAETIVRILAQLAKELGLSICAEGAEDVETLEFLRRLGCDKVQGYVISKPLLADELADFVRSGVFTGGQAREP